MNRQIYKMTLSDASDSITFYLLEVPIADDDITGTARNTTIDGNVYEDYLWLKKQWSQKWSIMCKDEYDKLRGIWKRQYTDSEVVSVKYFYGDNIYTDGEVEGDTMQINNDSEVYEGEIRTVKLLGNATQKTLSGKNLSNIYTIPNQTGANLKVNVADEKITISDNANAIGYTNTTIKLSVLCPTLQVGDTVYLFFDTTSSSTQKDNIYIQGTGANIYWAKATSKTITQAMLDANIILYGGHDETAVISNFMITKTNDATYEPYCGGIPSPNPNYPQDVETVSGAQTVKITGKNLCYSANRASNTTLEFFCECATIKSPNVALSFITDFTTTGNASVYSFVDGVDLHTTVGLIATTAGQRSATTLDLTAIMSQIKDGTTLRLMVYRGGSTFTSVSDAMIVNGSTPVPYEPYQAQSQEINLGKNLLNLPDGTYSNNGITATVAEGKITLTGTATATSFVAIDIPPITLNSAWSFSLNNTVYGDSNSQIRLYEDDGTNYVGLTSSVANAKSENRTNFGTYNKVQIRTSSGVVAGGATAQPQVELGTQSTPYSAYKTPIELAKIGTYQDYIWKDEGTWKIHQAVRHLTLAIADMSNGENWPGWQNVPHARDDFGANLNTQISLLTTWASNIALVAKYLGINTTSGQSTLFTWNNAAGIFGAMTQSDVKTAYPDLAMELYYGLPQANQTDTEITDSELIEQLNHIYSLYQGQNNLWLIPSAGADGTMTLDYRIDYEKETVVQDTTPVLLDLTDDGIINACQCRQNVKITMRETVQ